nr:hypothetical protein [Sphaerochaeta halotolerans]
MKNSASTVIENQQVQWLLIIFGGGKPPDSFKKPLVGAVINDQTDLTHQSRSTFCPEAMIH